MSQRVDWKSGFKAEVIVGEICAVSPYRFGDKSACFSSSKPLMERLSRACRELNM